jgi:predicted permease
MSGAPGPDFGRPRTRADEPPRAAAWLLGRLLHPADRDCALSDLDEEFEERCEREGESAARRWYWDQTRRSIVPSLARRLSARRLARSATPPDVASARRSRVAGLAGELKWAWRGVRRRGWTAAFQIGLLALALAANAVVFSATDAFVFRRVPYPNADRLVVLQNPPSDPGQPSGPPASILTQEIHEWRHETDVLAAVHAYEQYGTAYVTIGDVTDSVPAEIDTPGLFAALGVRPQWGRPFTNADVGPGAPPAAIISQTLAREVYGDPAAAIGRTLPVDRTPPVIVGVMPAGFFFPSAAVGVWRPLDLDAPLPPGASSRAYTNIALAAPGLSAQAVVDRVAARAPSVASRIAGVSSRALLAAPIFDEMRDPHASLFALLFGAAAALLLIACLNVASLELAGAMTRLRVFAIQSTLGASRGALARTALLEGALLTAGAVTVAFGLSLGGTAALRALLPPSVKDGLMTPITVDDRALAFMAIAGAGAWLVTSAPVVWRASRSNLNAALRIDAHGTSISRRGAIGRQLLTAAQVALTVLLLVGALLYVRTYVAHATEPKGFDSRRLASIEILRSAAAPPAADIAEQVLARLDGMSFVRASAQTGTMLPRAHAGIGGPLSIDGRPPLSFVILRTVEVDSRYASAMGLTIQQGRWFRPGDGLGSLVVDESFARRFWPDGKAVGSQFYLGAGKPSAGINRVNVFNIVGVAAHMRTSPVNDDWSAGIDSFVVYNQISPKYIPLDFVVRLDDTQHLGAVVSAVRAIAGPSVVRAELVDDRYAALYGDTRVAAQITTGFGILALLVALAGIYGVVTFIVAGRTREIGIRMALGAEPSAIQRLVVGSSAVFIAGGALAGLTAALGASRWMASQLFGVTATDPLTYVGVAALIVATSAVALWRPARRAAHVDPALTLRAE